MMDEIKKLRQDYEELMDQLIDLKFQQKYNKEIELIEFLKDLYNSLNLERLKEYSKEDIIRNLKDYIQEFIKNNNICMK